MRCNPKRWVWGLFPIAILTWIAGLNEYDRIEADLRLRTQAALLRERHAWAAASFDGRDGVLSGRGWEQGEAATALEAARRVWGVRAMEDRTDLPGKIDSYVWSATLRDDRVKLAGFVPNEATQKAIVGVARAAFPKSTIADRMKLARGAPPRNAWLGGVSFALEQLSHLRRGMVYLDDSSLSVTGEAESPATYKSLKAALHGGLPAGLRLASDKVLPPSVSPYRWEARIAANQLVLSGYVPSEELRDKLFEHAKAAAPWMTLADRTDIALGAPQDWRQAAEAGLNQLARLEDGAVVLRDSEVAIEGVASDQGTAERVRAGLKEEVPPGFKASAAVRVNSQPMEAATPFVTVVSALNGHVDLLGHAPSMAARAALIATVSAKVPGKPVEDKLRVAAGAPPGWRACLDAGLLALGRLGGVGRLELTDERLEIAGRVDDEAVAAALPGDVKAAAGQACEVHFRVDLVAPSEPRLKWKAQWTGEEIALEGEVPDSATKTGLARSATGLFPGSRVIDRMTVVPAPPGKWAGVAEAGLRQLARLRHGQAALSGKDLTVRGEAPDEATAASVRHVLGSEVAAGYEAHHVLDVKTHAAIAAEREARAGLRALEAERKRAEAGRGRGSAGPEAEWSRPQAGADRMSAYATGDAEAGLGAAPSSDQCRKYAQALATTPAIRFDRSSASLDPRSRPVLDRIAKIASLCPRARIEINGHTDAEGGVERNLKLSEQRAQSVVTWLTEAGVDATRLRAVGYGEARPAVPNDTADNRARNRRIEFSVEVN